MNTNSKSLSQYFSWFEVTRSSVADRLKLDNTIPTVFTANVKYAASKMDYIRIILSVAILVDSWYRCIDLNRVLGSKDTSDHLRGLAIDFIAPDFGSPLEICKYLLQYKNTIGWKQLILEHTWVHISFYPSLESSIGRNNEVLTLLHNGSYAIGLTDRYGNVV